MSALPRPIFRSFKEIGRNWFKRTRPNYLESKPSFEFTVASYNVLADKLLHGHPHLYFNRGKQESWIFDWNYRKNNLLAEIKCSDADILCLQEVQEEHYHNWFNPKLKEFGYTGIYIKRSGDKKDGCATFFKHDMFNMDYYELISFNKPLSRFMNRDNVAILTVLTPRSGNLKGVTPICIGNTHLLFNTKRGDIKLAQLAHLFAEIDRIAIGTNYKLPVILCGDFNSIPFSPLYNFLTSGVLQFNGMSKTVISGQDKSINGANFMLGDSILPFDLGLTHNCKWRNYIKNEYEKPWLSHFRRHLEDVKFTSNNHVNESVYLTEEREKPGILTHGLDLTSCYMHRLLDGSQEVTTCHDRACSTVDYIFYSPGYSPRTEQNQSQLWLSGVLSLLSEFDLQRMGKLPDKSISSDHLMLMSSFVLS